MKKRTIVQLVVIVLGWAGTAHADPGTISVSADCDGLTVTTADWTDPAAYGIVGLSTEGPPFALAPNVTMHLGRFDSTLGYAWSVSIFDQAGEHSQTAEVECEPAPPPPDIDYQYPPDTVPTPPPAPAAPQAWQDVALAPPW